MSQNKQSYIEKRIVSNEIVPDRLFACFADVDKEAGVALNKAYQTGESLPNDIADLHRQHLLHIYKLGENGARQIMPI